MAEIATIKKRIERTPGQESQAAKYGALGGAAVGGLLGAVGGKTPQTTMAGASGGSSLGGLIGGMFGSSTPGKTRESFELQAPQAEGSDAIQRRLQASQQDNLAVLRQAEAALQQLPKELRQEYAAPIVQATMAEERRRAMGG